MSFRDHVVNLFFKDIVAKRVREASLAEEDRLWRPVSGATGSRDLDYRELVDQMNDSAEAYRVNPLAYRIVELNTDFVLGRGMRVVAPDADVNRFVQAFWSHPMNRMAIRQFEICTELSISGEVFISFHTNPYDGMTYLRLIPAAAIDQIETNPDDVEDERRFHRLGSAPHPVIPAPRYEMTSNRIGTAEAGIQASAYTGRWFDAADCRHFAINRLVGAVRGQGDLVPLLPWLRRYKEWLTERVRINKFKSAFLWDVEMKGADRGAVARRQGELAVAPEPGSVLVHNESEVWKAVQPQIDGQSVEPDGKAMRLMVAAGAGIPLHFLAEGEGATRATAHEMGGPTLRHYERRQLYFSYLLTEIVREAVQRSQRFRGREVALEAKYEDIFTEDNLRIAQSAKTVADGLAVAVDRGWVKSAEARRVFERFCAEPLGVG